MTKFYAIVSDVTPSRCTVDKLIECNDADTALEVAHRENNPLYRVMPVAGGVSMHDWRRNRAWHDGEQIVGLG